MIMGERVNSLETEDFEKQGKNTESGWDETSRPLSKLTRNDKK